MTPDLAGASTNDRVINDAVALVSAMNAGDLHQHVNSRYEGSFAQLMENVGGMQRKQLQAGRDLLRQLRQRRGRG